MTCQRSLRIMLKFPISNISLKFSDVTCWFFEFFKLNKKIEHLSQLCLQGKVRYFKPPLNCKSFPKFLNPFQNWGPAPSLKLMFIGVILLNHMYTQTCKLMPLASQTVYVKKCFKCICCPLRFNDVSDVFQSQVLRAGISGHFQPLTVSEPKIMFSVDLQVFHLSKLGYLCLL